jgi:hypothetical protein
MVRPVRKRIGTYFVVAALVVTWPLHIGAFSYLVTELVGDLIAPHEDHVLFCFPIAAAGGVFLIALAAGIFMRYRWALYASAVVLLGGLFTVSGFFRLHPVIGRFTFMIGFCALGWPRFV